MAAVVDAADVVVAALVPLDAAPEEEVPWALPLVLEALALLPPDEAVEDTELVVMGVPTEVDPKSVVDWKIGPSLLLLPTATVVVALVELVNELLTLVRLPLALLALLALLEVKEVLDEVQGGQ